MPDVSLFFAPSSILSPMPNDPRARIFMPLNDFERSIQDLDPDAKRDARIQFVADGVSLYNDELHWKRHLRPPFIFWCLIPLAWPILWYRNGLSKMTLSALSRAIDQCRQRWADDLYEGDFSFEQIRDPLKQ